VGVGAGAVLGRAGGCQVDGGVGAGFVETGLVMAGERCAVVRSGLGASAGGSVVGCSNGLEAAEPDAEPDAPPAGCCAGTGSFGKCHAGAAP
jgi:hypothetical protein